MKSPVYVRESGHYLAKAAHIVLWGDLTASLANGILAIITIVELDGP